MTRSQLEQQRYERLLRELDARLGEVADKFENVTIETELNIDGDESVAPED